MKISNQWDDNYHYDVTYTLGELVYQNLSEFIRRKFIRTKVYPDEVYLDEGLSEFIRIYPDEIYPDEVLSG